MVKFIQSEVEVSEADGKSWGAEEWLSESMSLYTFETHIWREIAEMSNGARRR